MKVWKLLPINYQAIDENYFPHAVDMKSALNGSLEKKKMRQVKIKKCSLRTFFSCLDRLIHTWNSSDTHFFFPTQQVLSDCIKVSFDVLQSFVLWRNIFFFFFYTNWYHWNIFPLYFLMILLVIVCELSQEQIRMGRKSSL